MNIILFPSRRILKAETALNLGKKQEAIKLALPLTTAKDKEIAYRANRTVGLAYYKLKIYNKSVELLTRTCELGNYRHDWYNLAMAQAFDSDFESANTTFNHIYRTNVQPGYMYTLPVPSMLFQFMKVLIKKGDLSGAKVRANELKQMYDGVGKTNIEQQVQRGLPAYSAFCNEVERLFKPGTL